MSNGPTFRVGARVRANDRKSLQSQGGVIEALENSTSKGPRVTVRWDYSGKTTRIATRRFGPKKSEYTQTTE